MNDFRQQFLDFAMAREVIRFGEFNTKAGRKSPYLFNEGLFSDGASRLGVLTDAGYAAGRTSRRLRVPRDAVPHRPAATP